MWIRILEATAIPMEVPKVYGAFHLVLTALLIAGSVACARYLSTSSERTRIRILAGTGWFLIGTEIYKQLFFYYIVNHGVYDYWFLPFQLCSIPMYCCVLLPHLRGQVRQTVLTFLQCYTFVSAAATFVYPADLMRPWLLLTIHGFLWHGLLLFLSLLIAFSGMADLSARGFLRATGLFLSLAVTALILNAGTEPLAHAAHAAGAPHSYPNMFYLNPYHLSTQPLVGAVQEAWEIPAGLILYLAAIVLLAWCVRLAFLRVCREFKNSIFTRKVV